MKTGIYTILVEHFAGALELDPKLKKFIESKPTYLGSQRYFEALEKAVKKAVRKDLLVQADKQMTIVELTEKQSKRLKAAMKKSK